MRGKPSIFTTTKDGCIVSTSHRLNQDISGTDLGELFGVSFSTGCKWIREWKCRD